MPTLRRDASDGIFCGAKSTPFARGLRHERRRGRQTRSSPTFAEEAPGAAGTRLCVAAPPAFSVPAGADGPRAARARRYLSSGGRGPRRAAGGGSGGARAAELASQSVLDAWSTPGVLFVPSLREPARSTRARPASRAGPSARRLRAIGGAGAARSGVSGVARRAAVGLDVGNQASRPAGHAARRRSWARAALDESARRRHLGSRAVCGALSRRRRGAVASAFWSSAIRTAPCARSSASARRRVPRGRSSRGGRSEGLTPSGQRRAAWLGHVVAAAGRRRHNWSGGRRGAAHGRAPRRTGRARAATRADQQRSSGATCRRAAAEAVTAGGEVAAALDARALLADCGHRSTSSARASLSLSLSCACPRLSPALALVGLSAAQPTAAAASCCWRRHKRSPAADDFLSPQVVLGATPRHRPDRSSGERRLGRRRPPPPLPPGDAIAADDDLRLQLDRRRLARGRMSAQVGEARPRRRAPIGAAEAGRRAHEHVRRRRRPPPRRPCRRRHRRRLLLQRRDRAAAAPAKVIVAATARARVAHRKIAAAVVRPFSPSEPTPWSCRAKPAALTDRLAATASAHGRREPALANEPTVQPPSGPAIPSSSAKGGGSGEPQIRPPDARDRRRRRGAAQDGPAYLAARDHAGQRGGPLHLAQRARLARRRTLTRTSTNICGDGSAARPWNMSNACGVHFFSRSLHGPWTPSLTPVRPSASPCATAARRAFTMQRPSGLFGDGVTPTHLFAGGSFAEFNRTNEGVEAHARDRLGLDPAQPACPRSLFIQAELLMQDGAGWVRDSEPAPPAASTNSAAQSQPPAREARQRCPAVGRVGTRGHRDGEPACGLVRLVVDAVEGGRRCHVAEPRARNAGEVVCQRRRPASARRRPPRCSARSGEGCRSALDA